MRTHSMSAALLLMLASPLGAQVVHGTVVDAQTGASVAGARVRLVIKDAAADSALTGTDGRFALRGGDDGVYRLVASRVGYAATVSKELELGVRDSVEVLFRVAAQTVELEPLEVVATLRRHSPRLKQFYDRAETRRLGQFLTREEIERRKPIRTSELLRGMQGVRLVPVRLSNVVRGRDGCRPLVFVDGARMGRTGADYVDDWVDWTTLEGVEVYSGYTTLPPDFAAYQNRCGAILFWTRDGGERAGARRAQGERGG